MKGIGILLFLLLLPALSWADVDFEVKSECSSEKVIKRRVDVKGESLEVCAVSEKTEEKEFGTVSAATPWFGFGRLKTRGLLTEAMNPCGYSPASEVFFESARLVLDRSIGESGTYGVFARPMTGLTCFSLGNKDYQYILRTAIYRSTQAPHPGIFLSPRTMAAESSGTSFSTAFTIKTGSLYP